MAFTNAQRKNHIHEIQRYLHTLSYFNSSIPRVIPDGFYGKETALAVRAFQREYGLPETGAVDSMTWNKIVEEYKRRLHAKPLAYNIFPSSGYVLRKGDSGLIVYVVEAMLNEIGRSYDNMPELRVTGVYDDSTETAVRRFQSRVGIPQNGNVDSSTWNMLVRASEHNSNTIKNANQNNS